MSNNVTEPARNLLFLPGLDGTEVFLEPLVKALPESVRSRVVCFPTRGSNRYEDLLEITRQSVRGIDEYYVAAWSFSGPLALMLAAAEPNKVRGIILFSSFVRAPLRFLTVFRFAAVTPVVWTVRAGGRIPVWVGHRPSDPFQRTKAELRRRVDSRIL